MITESLVCKINNKEHIIILIELIIIIKMSMDTLEIKLDNLRDIKQIMIIHNLRIIMKAKENIKKMKKNKK